MSFAHALCYPWISIRDVNWLKSAVLCWEHISTIVPASVSNPYQTAEAELLEKEGILTPLRVNQEDDEVTQSARDFEAYMLTIEGICTFALFRSVSGRKEWTPIPRLNPDRS